MFILDGENNPQEVDAITWSKWMYDPVNRRICETRVKGLLISTVFLGISHSFSAIGRPLLFETMVFVDNDKFAEKFCDRYPSCEEALRGHLHALRLVIDGEFDEKRPVTNDGPPDDMNMLQHNLLELQCPTWGRNETF